MITTVGVMQPYFFPYLGYWQLIHAVDHFIIYDDVQYIKSGYVNRNRILNQGKPHFITLQVQGASSNKLINEVQVGQNRKKLLKTISQTYAKAPYFADVMPILETCLTNTNSNLSAFLSDSLIVIADYLQIKTKFHVSSNIEKSDDLDRTERLFYFCDYFSSTHYINAYGGRDLYDKEEFGRKNIKLSFIRMKEVIYPQIKSEEFHPSLSIIDVLMHNSLDDTKVLLNKFELL